MTVSISGPAIVGYRAATTDVNGNYQFPTLPAGTYTLTCELLGYQPVHREGIVISPGQASSLALGLAPAALQPEASVETAAEPPVIDTKVAAAPVTFTNNQLYDVPNATNMWAALDMTPGIQMRGYDVAGSHKGEQTEYETFGIRGQNRIVNDGVNTTEGTDRAGGYYDYYAIDEFKITGQGAGVEMSTPGAQVVATWKGGTNRFTGVIQGDFGTEEMVNDNFDDDLAERGATPTELREFYEYHVDLGGPIVKDRAWFYAAYNRFFVDRPVSGQDPEIATEIADFDMVTGKLNIRLTDKDHLVGFGHWSFEQRPNGGLSLTVPSDSVLAQESRTKVFKGEWQRKWSDRLSSTVMVGYFGNERVAVPVVDPAISPPRLDTATGVQSGAGWAPFTSTRWKPQSTGQISYHLPTDKVGSHDLKVGWDWQIDRNGPAWSEASGAIRYLDNSAYGRATSLTDVFVDRILFANVPNEGETDHNQHTDFFGQDVWRVNDRLTLNLGLRVGKQDIYHTEISNAPIQGDIFVPASAPRTDVLERWGVAPRVGAVIDPTGRGQTILKAYFGRFYANVGSGLPEATLGGRRLEVREFLDLNENGIYDGGQELGELLEASGGGLTGRSRLRAALHRRGGRVAGAGAGARPRGALRLRAQALSELVGQRERGPGAESHEPLHRHLHGMPARAGGIEHQRVDGPGRSGPARRPSHHERARAAHHRGQRHRHGLHDLGGGAHPALPRQLLPDRELRQARPGRAAHPGGVHQPLRGRPAGAGLVPEPQRRCPEPAGNQVLDGQAPDPVPTRWGLRDGPEPALPERVPVGPRPPPPRAQRRHQGDLPDRPEGEPLR